MQEDSKPLELMVRPWKRRKALLGRETFNNLSLRLAPRGFYRITRQNGPSAEMGRHIAPGG
jgi:hypothetical protein